MLQPFLQVAAGDTKGITVNKARIREALIKKVVQLTGGGFAYGKKMNDAQLETAMDSNPSDWKKMRGGEIEKAAQNVHDKLKTVVDADAAASPAPATPIGNYQVSAATLAELQSTIDSLSLVEQGPRAAKGMIKGANDQIAALVNRLDDKKETLRRLLPQLHESAPQFVTALQTAMTIVDAAASHAAPAPSVPATPPKP